MRRLVDCGGVQTVDGDSDSIEIEIVAKTEATQVLVVGRDDWAIKDATRTLTLDGRSVHHCCDDAESPFPCNAMIPGRGCPLDEHDIDVVLVVRGRPQTQPSLGEMGAVCAVRDGIPLVLAGITKGSPFAPWARHVPLGGDIVSTCDEAVVVRPL